MLHIYINYISITINLGIHRWQRTLRMARALCQVEAELFPNSLGNFPTSKQIASLNEHVLKKRCKLGYRARTILQFAKNIELGKININEYEEHVSWKPLYKALKKNRGFGPFVCANIMFCIGFYNKVPSDSETVRHLKEVGWFGLIIFIINY